MKKYAILIIMALSGILNAFAQEEETTNDVAIEKERDWYVELGAGAQMLFSSDADLLKFRERITPSISLTLGKWLTPKYGVRLQVGGYALNGYSTVNGLYIADPQNNGSVFGRKDPVTGEVTVKPDGSYPHYIRYINPHVDIQASVAHLFSEDGWGRWDVIPAVGIGYFGTFNYKGVPNVNTISTNFSVMGKYAICNRFDINMEVSTVVLPGFFDGRITDNLYENTLSTTLGVTYTLSYKDRVKAKVKEIALEELTSQAIVKTVHDTLYIEQIVEVEKIVTELPNNFRLSSILFGISQSTPLQGQEVQFYNIAEFLNNNPEIKILVEGFGDKETGTEEVNLKISVLRANEVRRLLIEKYGVDADKITAKGNGSSMQPYPDKRLNRVAVISVVK